LRGIVDAGDRLVIIDDHDPDAIDYLSAGGPVPMAPEADRTLIPDAPARC
jgi:hypothetical protein